MVINCLGYEVVVWVVLKGDFIEKNLEGRKMQLGHEIMEIDILQDAIYSLSLQWFP